MAKRKTLTDVRQCIRLQINLLLPDLESDVQYVFAFARGRCLALELLCHELEFRELEKELMRLREMSYSAERERAYQDKPGAIAK